MKHESTVAADLEAIRAALGHTTVTASTMNFVVWIPNTERRAWILDRTAMLAEKHPSFTLVLDASGRAHGAAVSSGDRDAISHFTVQGERVDVAVDETDPDEVEAFVASLTGETVPTVLWWNGLALEGDPVFERLLPHTAALVVDSSGVSAESDGARNLARFHGTHPEIPVHDLAWLRLAPWHDLIATFFDDPAAVDELFSIRSLRVTSGSDAEALYLASWLASRLGWTAAAKDEFRDRSGKPIAFEHAREGRMRRVRSVCLDSETSWYHGEVDGETEELVRVWVEGAYPRDERFFPLTAIDNASLIERALLSGRTDEVFETALRSLATIAG